MHLLLCVCRQIVEGRLDKIKKQYALLEQPALRDNNKTVGELIKETIAATGENIQVGTARGVWHCRCMLKGSAALHGYTLGAHMGLEFGHVSL
jgi:hypothetical protein